MKLQPNIFLSFEWNRIQSGLSQKKNVDEAELIRKERNLIILKNITRFDINLNVNVKYIVSPLYTYIYFIF